MFVVSFTVALHCKSGFFKVAHPPSSMFKKKTASFQKDGKKKCLCMLSALFGIGRPVKPSLSSDKEDDYIKNEYGYSFLISTIDMLSKLNS